MFLEVVAHARDVGGHLHIIGEPHPRDLAQRGIGFLGRSGLDLKADTPALGTLPQSRSFSLFKRLLSAFANKLIYCWQIKPPKFCRMVIYKLNLFYSTDSIHFLQFLLFHFLQ